MSCNCIKDDEINFNIEVDVINEKSINILDLSSFSIQDSNITTYQVTIEHPTKRSNTVDLNINTITRLKSEHFASDFCDGIYCFTLESCGLLFKKRVAITYELECGLASLVAVDVKKAMEVSENIKQIKNAAKMADNDTALELYTITKRILRNYNCNCK